MSFPVVSNPESQWLTPGSPADPRLLHCDPDDTLLVYPADQGYRQEVALQDDLSLKIIDYTLHQDTIFQSQRHEGSITLELQLTESGVENGYLKNSLGGHALWFTPARQRVFELEVVLKKSLVNKYAQMVAERLPDRIQSVFRQLLEYSYGGSQRRGQRLTDAELFNRFLKRQAVVQSDYEPALKLTPSLFGEAVDFGYAIRPIVTPAIKKIAAQILSCPYRGGVRRRFLRDKALALISEYLETVYQPAYPLEEMDRICEAAAILRANITNPPGIEELARRVYTNRLKLYQGFHAVYGTTPVGYLRSYRISVALKQFYTSTRSVSQVAAEVGYSNRSRFASAFYQLVGMNPKTFQLQLQRQAS